MSSEGFGRRLREARERCGLLGEQVAAALGCNVRTLYRWERGEFEPPLEKLVRLSELYRVTTDHLIHGDNAA
jgi:transcriptional regulator with XRE-family HTH domain